MHKTIETIKINIKRMIRNCTKMFNQTTEHSRRKWPSNLFENG